jgi:hypothetical protein
VLDVKILPWDPLRSDEAVPDLGSSLTLVGAQSIVLVTTERSVLVTTGVTGTFTVQYLKDRIHKGNSEFLVLHLHSSFFDDLLSIFSM